MDKWRIGLKSGNFRLVNAGHIAALKKCAEQCDTLIVLIAEENRKNGPHIPIKECCFILENLSFINTVDYYTEPTEDKRISEIVDKCNVLNINPKREHFIMFHSSEWANSRFIPGEGNVDEVVFIPYQDQFLSTTEIIKLLHD